jgi:DNA repair exonuclease SbcCD ATPase subunit
VPPAASSANASGSHTAELQTLQLKLKDALLTLDQYRLQLSQQQGQITALQRQHFAPTLAPSSGLDPEISALQHHVLTLSDRVVATEALVSALQSELAAAHTDAASSREHVVALRKESALSAQHASRLSSLCGEYKAEVQHWVDQHQRQLARADDAEAALAQARATLEAAEAETSALRQAAQGQAEEAAARASLERRLVEVAHAHAGVVAQLRNEALLAQRQAAELRSEHAFVTEQQRQQLQEQQGAHQSELLRARTELELLRAQSASALEALQAHYAHALRSLQQQFGAYRETAQATLAAQQAQHADEADAAARRHASECQLLHLAHQQSLRAVSLDKDSKILALLDNSGTDSILRQQQQQSARLREHYEQQLGLARQSAARAFAGELTRTKKQLSAATVELTHAQAQNRGLHAKLTSLGAQLSEATRGAQREADEHRAEAGQLRKRLEEAQEEAGALGGRVHKLTHQLLRARLAGEGRLPGDTGSSVSAARRAVESLESEVEALRAELSLRHAQVGHAVGAGTRAAERVEELERQLRETRAEHRRVLALLTRGAAAAVAEVDSTGAAAERAVAVKKQLDAMGSLPDAPDAAPDAVPDSAPGPEDSAPVPVPADPLADAYERMQARTVAAAEQRVQRLVAVPVPAPVPAADPASITTSGPGPTTASRAFPVRDRAGRLVTHPAVPAPPSAPAPASATPHKHKRVVRVPAVAAAEDASAADEIDGAAHPGPAALSALHRDLQEDLTRYVILSVLSYQSVYLSIIDVLTRLPFSSTFTAACKH